MALPSFFSATTLRAVLAAGGGTEQDVRAHASRLRLEVRLGDSSDAATAARILVELAARTFANIRLVEGTAGLRAELTGLIAQINPRHDQRPKSPVHSVSVRVNASGEADVAMAGHGWWVGPDHQVDALPAVALGPLAAGVLAFNEAFKIAFEPLLRPAAPRAIDSVGWSLRTMSAGGLSASDLEPLEESVGPPTALIGCGAVGQSTAYALGRLSLGLRPFDLIDPEAVSRTNLQRYIGSHYADVGLTKTALAARQLVAVAPNGNAIRDDWAGFLRTTHAEPEIVLVGLDSASDRRIVQGSLPRWIVNGWTRLSGCGVSVHGFSGDQQCLVCTYLDRDGTRARNDLQRLVGELGIEPMRAIALLTGASLEPSDLRTIERHRRLAAETLQRWKGESVRPLFGQLCGMAAIPVGERDEYVVPLPQTSALAGVLVAAQYVNVTSGRAESFAPVDVDLLRGPGPIWALPPALKSQHPARCVCKDPVYLNAYAEKWT